MRKILLRKEYVNLGNLLLVNKENKIKDKIKDCNLKPFNEEYTDILLDYNANIELQKLLKTINAENEIIPISGYRTLEEQTKIYEDSLKDNGENFTKKYVAFPNCSEHQTGLAIDLALNKKDIDFIRPEFPHTGICQKFREEAIKYGFIERYIENKKDITQISAEEWHFRYVGYPHSEIMKEKKFCLEEYIEYLKKFKEKSLNFKKYEISYIVMDENVKEIEIEDECFVTVSGNNKDGIILTKRRR